MRRSRRASKYARRPRDVPYMLWVKTLPCAARELEGAGPCSYSIEADHAGARSMSQKADDRTCIPLCTRHHAARTAFHGVFWTWNRERMRAWLAEVVQRTTELRAQLDATAELEACGGTP